MDIVEVTVSPAETSFTLIPVGSDVLEITMSAEGDVLNTVVSSSPDVIQVSVDNDGDVLEARIGGQRGETGPPGFDGDLTFSRRAGTNLSADRVVVPQSDGSVIYADSATLNNAVRPLWLTLTAALSGDSVDLISFGFANEPSWVWIAGNPIFLGQSGILTQTPPSLLNGDAFILEVASPISVTEIYYNPRNPIAF